MKSHIWIVGFAVSLALLSSGQAIGQCRGGGGQGGSRGNAVVSAGGASVGTGQLLTSPGSLYHDVMMQQQMQQAAARQQYAMAVAKAQKAKAKYEARLANAQKHRAEAANKLEADRVRRSTALAKQ